MFGNTSFDALLVLYICIYELCFSCIAYVFVKPMYALHL